MPAAERREQLLEIATALFAEKGFDGTSVEEIAAEAGVSKPVVYEHFGGKEGAYQAIVQRESGMLWESVAAKLDSPDARSRELMEYGALALLNFIDERPDGFRILSRDTAEGSFASLLSRIAAQVEELLLPQFIKFGHDPQFVPLYAQALVGLVAQTGQQWLERREPSKEILAKHLMNLAWNGIAHLETDPRLVTLEDQSKTT